jgi:hypothetical protein
VELLLNILWLALATGAVAAFVRSRVEDPARDRLPCVPALLALGCAVVLLFPFVSATDDLHPTQEVFEDSSKRVQQTTGPSAHAHKAHAPAVLLCVSNLAVLIGPMVSQRLESDASPVVIGFVEQLLDPGRAPPYLS